MDRRKKGEYIGALGALLVHVAVIALLILVSFTVPQPDEDAGGVPVMMGNVDAASGFDDPSLVDVDIMDEDAAAPVETAPELPSEQDLLTQTEEETVTLKPKTEEPKKETVKPLQFSVSGAVGAQVNATKRLGIYVEPGVAYYFDDGSDIQTIRKENPFNFNIQAGIRLTY